MRTRSTIHQIIMNTLSGWGAMGIQAAIGLVMVPFMLGHVGREGYGLIGLLGVIVSFSSVADLGLRSSLGRELSEQVARKDVQAFSELASSALALYLAIATILVAVGWVLAPWLVEVFNVSQGLKESAVWAIRIYGSLSVVFSFVTPVFGAGLTSNNRFDTVNAVGIICGVITSLLLFLVIPRVANPLYGWIGIMIVQQVVILVFYYVLFRRQCYGARIGLDLIRLDRLKPLFQLGGYMYVLQLTNMLAERSDPLVITHFMGPAGVALYQAGAKINEMIRPVVLTLSTQAHPLTTRYHVQDHASSQHRLLIDGTKYTLYLGIIASLGIIFFATPFCKLWLAGKLGSDYLTAARVMQLWALASMVNYSGAMHWPLLLGMKKMKFALMLQIPSALINIVLSIYFVGFTNAGIPGVLYATVLTEILRRPFAIWYTAKIAKLNLWDYLKKGYGMALLYLATIAVPGFLVLQHRQSTDWMQLILGAIFFGIYATIVLCVVEWKLVAIILKTAWMRSRLQKA